MNYYLVSLVALQRMSTDPKECALQKVFINSGRSADEIEMVAEIHAMSLLGDVDIDEYIIMTHAVELKRRSVIFLAYEHELISKNDLALTDEEAHHLAADIINEYEARGEHEEAMKLVEAQLRFVERPARMANDQSDSG